MTWCVFWCCCCCCCIAQTALFVWQQYHTVSCSCRQLYSHTPLSPRMPCFVVTTTNNLPTNTGSAASQPQQRVSGARYRRALWALCQVGWFYQPNSWQAGGVFQAAGTAGVVQVVSGSAGINACTAAILPCAGNTHTTTPPELSLPML